MLQPDGQALREELTEISYEEVLFITTGRGTHSKVGEGLIALQAGADSWHM